MNFNHGLKYVSAAVGAARRVNDMFDSPLEGIVEDIITSVPSAVRGVYTAGKWGFTEPNLIPDSEDSPRPKGMIRATGKWVYEFLCDDHMRIRLRAQEKGVKSFFKGAGWGVVKGGLHTLAGYGVVHVPVEAYKLVENAITQYF